MIMCSSEQADKTANSNIEASGTEFGRAWAGHVAYQHEIEKLSEYGCLPDAFVPVNGGDPLEIAPVIVGVPHDEFWRGAANEAVYAQLREASADDKIKFLREFAAAVAAFQHEAGLDVDDNTIADLCITVGDVAGRIVTLAGLETQTLTDHVGTLQELELSLRQRPAGGTLAERHEKNLMLAMLRQEIDRLNAALKLIPNASDEADGAIFARHGEELPY